MRFFLTKTNTFYTFVIHRHILTLYALSLGIIISITAAWFFGCYRPCNNAIKKLEAQIQADEVTIQSTPSLQAQRKQLRESIQRLKKIEATRDEMMRQFQSPLTAITEAADKVGISIEQCALTAAHSKKKQQPQSLCCSFVAPFAKVIALFDQMSVQQVPIVCTELYMQQQGDRCDVRCTWERYQQIIKESV